MTEASLSAAILTVNSLLWDRAGTHRVGLVHSSSLGEMLYTFISLWSRNLCLLTLRAAHFLAGL